MPYPCSVRGFVTVADDAGGTPVLLERVAEAVHQENGWVTGRTAASILFTGAPWNLRRAGRALTLLTSGRAEVAEIGGSRRICYQPDYTSIILLAVVVVVWVGPFLYRASPVTIGAVLLAALVVILLIGLYTCRHSAGRFQRTLAAEMER